MPMPLPAALMTLADHVARAYSAHAQPRAILLTGSLADGVCDGYSDIDMSMYYDALPMAEQLAQARAALNAQAAFFLAPPTANECAEDFHLDGVECQISHVTIAEWEHTLDLVLVQLDLSPLQKTISGLLRGRALTGGELIQNWQARARAYPPALGKAMVEHYLHVFPLWYRAAFIRQRDMVLWTRELLVETGYYILGMLAGLNRHYFTPFQFKQMRHFIATLALAPADLGDRLERLANSDIASAISEAEALVSECIVLVNQYMPEVDTSATQRRLGQQQPLWSPE